MPINPNNKWTASNGMGQRYSVKYANLNFNRARSMLLYKTLLRMHVEVLCHPQNFKLSQTVNFNAFILVSSIAILPCKEGRGVYFFPFKVAKTCVIIIIIIIFNAYIGWTGEAGMAKHRVDSWFYSLFFLGIAVLIFFQRNNPSQSLQKMAEDTPKSVYDFTVKDIRGNDVGLGTYSGKVLLIVNVASKCGLTHSNYKELNILYEKYKDQGFEILAFPCNQFLSQEPGTNDEIQETVCTMFKAEFPIFDKVEVNGKNAAPLYNFLKTQKGGLFGDGIKWNFTKFLVGKDGKVVERYAPTTSPLKIEKDIQNLLGVS